MQVLRVKKNITYRNARKEVRKAAATPLYLSISASSSQDTKLPGPNLDQRLFNSTSSTNSNISYSHVLCGSFSQYHLPQTPHRPLLTQPVPNDANSMNETSSFRELPGNSQNDPAPVVSNPLEECIQSCPALFFSFIAD